MKLLAVGEVMAEIKGSRDEGFSVGFAGDTYNTAVYCARILGGIGSVGYMTHIGTDPLSNALRLQLREEGLSDAKITIDALNNIGIHSVSTDTCGERTFHYWRNQSAARNLFETQSDLDNLSEADVIFLSAITIAILSPGARQRLVDHLANLKKEGRTLIAFDSNYRPKLWENAKIARDCISNLWEIAHIALPSIDDEKMLFEETAEQVVARFSKCDWKACAIKCGTNGPISPTLPTGNHPDFLPAENVIDTTAAGDSFNGGYLAAFLSGKAEIDCLLSGHNLARAVVQIPGAISPMEPN